MLELLNQLSKDFPIAVPGGLVLVGILVTWHFSYIYYSFKFVKQNMVTKQDVRLMRLELTREFDDRYVRRDSDPAPHRTMAAGRG